MLYRLAFVVLGLVALCSPALPQARADDGAVASLSPSPYLGQRSLMIAGKRVTIRVDLWRDLMPPMPPGGSPMAVHVTISCPNPGSLAGRLTIDSMRLRQGRSFWIPTLLTDDTLVATPFPAYSGFGGPTWEPGSVAHATVMLRFGRRVIPVNIPVRIAAVY